MQDDGEAAGRHSLRDAAPARTARTVAAPVTVRGQGIHTGAEGLVHIHPASSGAGVAFRLAGGATIPARTPFVVDATRCTVLGIAAGTTVATVEHLLSAFHGLGLTDALIEIDGPEVPILDGSAAPWVDVLRGTGFVDTPEPAAVTVARLPERVLACGAGGSFVAAYPSDVLRMTVAVSFDHPLVGTQVARYDPAAGSDYVQDVAPARTFGFIEEVEALLAAGLARGGSFENAVVVYQDRYSTPLRFPAELAYHKLLDTLGDLYLAFGGPLPFPIDVVAIKPSHRRNIELARSIAQIAGVSVNPV